MVWSRSGYDLQCRVGRVPRRTGSSSTGAADRHCDVDLLPRDSRPRIGRSTAGFPLWIIPGIVVSSSPTAGIGWRRARICGGHPDLFRHGLEAVAAEHGSPHLPDQWRFALLERPCSASGFHSHILRAIALVFCRPACFQDEPRTRSAREPGERRLFSLNLPSDPNSPV